MNSKLTSIILSNKELILDIEKRGYKPVIVETVTKEFYVGFSRDINNSFIEIYSNTNYFLRTSLSNSKVFAIHEIDTSYIESLELVKSEMLNIGSERE